MIALALLQAVLAQPIDTTALATKADVSAATSAAAQAQSAANAATAAAQAAAARAATAVQSVNGQSGTAVTVPIPAAPDLTPYALKTQLPAAVDLTPYALKSQIPATPDLSGYAKSTDVTAAIGSATSGLATTTALNAAKALIPVPASTTPPMEQVAATTGTAGTYRPADAVQPRITRAGTATTASDGSWSITWTSALVATPVVLPVPVDAGAQPVMCTVSTRSTTGATGKCFRSQLLPSTITLLSALVSYNVLGGLASGVVVQVLAIPPTQ